MREYDKLTLVAMDNAVNAEGVSVETETGRATVYCELKSLGYREFYAAAQAGETADIIAVIYDAEYNHEPVAILRGGRYRVLKKYKIGIKLELTLAALPERGA